jgi:hypothetical protein
LRTLQVYVGLPVVPGEHDRVEVWFAERVVPVGEPQPHDVLQCVVGGADGGEPLPEPLGRQEVEAVEQTGLVAEERVDGGRGRAGVGGEAAEVQGVEPAVEDERGGAVEQPPPQGLVVNLGPTHLTRVS